MHNVLNRITNKLNRYKNDKDKNKNDNLMLNNKSYV